MPAYERKGWFVVEMPDGWVGEEEDGVVLLHHPDHSGAMHVTAQTLENRKPGDRIDVFIALRAYLRGVGIKVQPTKADRWTRDGLEGASYEHASMEEGEGPTFWRTWMITNQDVLATVTYNCPDSDRDIERADVDAVIQSLRLTRMPG